MYTADFHLIQADKDAYKPKGLTIADLRASIPDVALEMATREAIWSACADNMANVLLCLPEVEEEKVG